MKYQQGQIGRVFVARVEHGEDLLQEVKQLAVKENVRAACILALGALKNAALVTGPRECTIPPDPVWRRFDDGREIAGIGTLFWDEEGPVIHLHSSAGRGGVSLTGCLREKSEVYLVVEVIIIEFTGIDGIREMDPAIGLKILSFLGGR